MTKRTCAPSARQRDVIAQQEAFKKMSSKVKTKAKVQKQPKIFKGDRGVMHRTQLEADRSIEKRKARDVAYISSAGGKAKRALNNAKNNAKNGALIKEQRKIDTKAVLEKVMPAFLRPDEELQV